MFYGLAATEHAHVVQLKIFNSLVEFLFYNHCDRCCVCWQRMTVAMVSQVALHLVSSLYGKLLLLQLRLGDIHNGLSRIINISKSPSDSAYTRERFHFVNN